MAHVYDWARSRGYWLRRGDGEAPTHLLLDGGRLRVPAESHAAMLNAYAASLARHPDHKPCVVELRTPVFKMFVDLDTRFPSEAEAMGAKFGGLPRLVRTLTECVGASRAMVCVASAVKREADACWKLGFHVVWPEVLVTAATALRLREHMASSLGPPADHGIVGGWDTVIDASVYRANGLRMPWSAKGPTDHRFYELAFVLGDTYAAVKATTVSAVREALHQLSIRTHDADPTLCLGGDHDDTTGGAATTAVRTRAHSLGAYPQDVLDALSASLPSQFADQKFTGVVATEHCFMLRSTAQYCFNLGRPHKTNTVYFMLTRKGVCQKCFCRCETTEGRKYGMCKDFASPYWHVPDVVLKTFFPDDDDDSEAKRKPAAAAAKKEVASMPSRSGKSFLSIDNLVKRSRPAMSPPKQPKQQARRKA